MKTPIILAALLLFAIVCGAQTNLPAGLQGVQGAPVAMDGNGHFLPTTSAPEIWTFGSTNPPPAAWKWKTANDAAELLGDFGIRITGKEIISIAGLMVALSGAARGYRKFVPDRLQANKLGLWMAHIALEVNPTLEKLRAAAQSPAGQSIEALIEAKISARLDSGKPQQVGGPQRAPDVDNPSQPQPQPPATAQPKTP